MPFDEEEAQTSVNEMFEEFEKHKDYAQEVKQCLRTAKMLIDTKEDYRDWANDPEGKVKTKIHKAKNIITGEEFTDAEKTQLLQQCKAKFITLKADKP